MLKRVDEALVDDSSEHRMHTVWAFFDYETTNTIFDSHNVSSITDNGVGDYTVNFAITLPHANYNILFGQYHGTGTSTAALYEHSSYARTTTYVRLINADNPGDPGNTDTNVKRSSVNIFCSI